MPVEIIVEKTVEIPVEIYIEKTVEVPVEIEKIVYKLVEVPIYIQNQNEHEVIEVPV